MKVHKISFLLYPKDVTDIHELDVAAIVHARLNKVFPTVEVVAHAVVDIKDETSDSALSILHN